MCAIDFQALYCGNRTWIVGGGAGRVGLIKLMENLGEQMYNVINLVVKFWKSTWVRIRAENT